MWTRRAMLAAGAGVLLKGQAQRRTKPNLIFILADDLGYGDLGCYGQSQIATPNLDRFASEGTRFTQAYAGSTVCAPSRCALMTGLHTGHCRIRGNKRLSLLPEDTTVADVFHRAGYRTGIFGKWGLADAGDPGTPNRKGFDDWFGYLNQVHAHNYYPEHLWSNEGEVLFPGNWGNQKKTYSHDVIARRGLEFIDRHLNDPFFLYLAFTIPHANNEAVQYAGHGMEVPDLGQYAQRDWPPQERAFAAMVTRLDATVGQVLARLGQHGIEKDTLVLFSSDNGPHKEGKHDPGFFRSGGPLRGIKRDLYEGGIRVPFLARWPGHIPARRTSEELLAFWDLLPTAAELTGQTTPEGLDGASMLPALTGKGGIRRNYLYWEFYERGFQQAARQGDWKALRLARNQPLELYNLREDIGETHNVAAEHPDVIRRMEDLLRQAHHDSPDFPVNGPDAAVNSRF